MSDFIGFTIDGVHSNDLGIVRTSNGSRFDNNLLPALSDYSTTVAGRDGSYFFGRDYKNATLNLSIAYDTMTELQKRKLQAILNKREPIKLVFDEAPYKTYYVLSTTNSKLNFMCFSIDLITSSSKSIYDPGYVTEVGRVYKGEGTLVFNAIDPYGHCKGDNKYIEAYNAIELNDWNPAINLKSKSTIDKYVAATGTTSPYFIVYNPGDKDSKVKLYLQFRDTSALGTEMNINDITISLGSKLFNIHNLKLTKYDTGIVLNGSSELIIGIDAANKENTTIYNQYINNGYFIDIKPTYNVETGTKETAQYFVYVNIDGTAQLAATPIIEYDYLFI